MLRCPTSLIATVFLAAVCSCSGFEPGQTDAGDTDDAAAGDTCLERIGRFATVPSRSDDQCNDVVLSAPESIDTSDGVTGPALSNNVLVTTGYVAIIAATIRFDAPIVASGDRPLLIAADSIEIGETGGVDVSSSFETTMSTTIIGAGSRSECGSAEGQPGIAAGSAGGSGGGGGALSGNGGSGGDGGDDANGNGGRPGGAGGSEQQSISELLGGCPGGDVGAGTAEAGLGGGAVYLLARTIRIAGRVLAGGQGGDGGFEDDGTLFGGAGGGSGGMIVLEVSEDGTIVLEATALLAANGGGGGGGTVSNDSLGRNRGSDAKDQNAAPGGDSPAENGSSRGGRGSGVLASEESGDGEDGQAIMAPGFSGSGGGGGAGLIVFEGALEDDSGAVVSPRGQP